MEIGSKLKQARKEKGITQEQAAERLGVSRQTLSHWENNRSYPDIVRVLQMSELYAVSLDHLLKEEITMKQTYRDFLEESTNTVKAKRTVSKMILLSTYFILWVAAMLIFWHMRDPWIAGLDVTLRWVVLPLLLLVATVTVAKQDWWGKGNWLCVIGAALTFLTVPYTEYVEDRGTASFIFRFPNFGYMIVGILIACCGITIGLVWRAKALAKVAADNREQ